MGHRVAITGVGVVANCGIGVESFFRGLLEGPPAGDGRVHDFDPSVHAGVSKRDARRMHRFSLFALAAAGQAVEQAAGAALETPFRSGVMIGSGGGGNEVIEDGGYAFYSEGPDAVSHLTVPMWIINAAAAQVSIRHGMTGPCEALVTACASGSHAMIRAAQLIADGRVDVMLAGGSEAGMSGTNIAAFANIGAHSPSLLSRPFDAERDGFVMSEGAGMVLLERWDLAVERGANILAEFGGGGSTADSYHITAPKADGVAARGAVELALAEAQVAADEVTYVNAHGTSTPLNDQIESRLYYEMFGRAAAVTSIKGVTGHSLGAAGAIELVSVVASMHEKVIPPTAGLKVVDPDLADIDLVVGEPRPWTPGPAVSNSFGFGGHNASIVVKPVER